MFWYNADIVCEKSITLYYIEYTIGLMMTRQSVSPIIKVQIVTK